MTQCVYFLCLVECNAIQKVKRVSSSAGSDLFKGQDTPLRKCGASVHACMRSHMHTCSRDSLHACTSKCIVDHMHMYMPTTAYTRTCIHAHTHTHTNIHTHLLPCLRTYLPIHRPTYLPTYLHTYIRT